MTSHSHHGAGLFALVVPAIALVAAAFPLVPALPKPPPPQVTLTECQQAGGTVEDTRKGNQCEGGQYDRSPVVGE